MVSRTLPELGDRPPVLCWQSFSPFTPIRCLFLLAALRFQTNRCHDGYIGVTGESRTLNRSGRLEIRPRGGMERQIPVRNDTLPVYDELLTEPLILTNDHSPHLQPVHCQSSFNTEEKEITDGPISRKQSFAAIMAHLTSSLIKLGKPSSQLQLWLSGWFRHTRAQQHLKSTFHCCGSESRPRPSYQVKPLVVTIAIGMVMTPILQTTPTTLAVAIMTHFPRNLIQLHLAQAIFHQRHQRRWQSLL